MSLAKPAHLSAVSSARRAFSHRVRRSEGLAALIAPPIADGELVDAFTPPQTGRSGEPDQFSRRIESTLVDVTLKVLVSSAS